jgi:hypothetical protein
MRPVEKVLDRLESVRQSNGSWKALCPAHEDREPSLSVTEGDDGRALLKCFAGCKNPEIVAALDLDMSDLFVQRNGHRKKFRSTPSSNTATVQPRELRRSQGAADRVAEEARHYYQEVPGPVSGTHPLPHHHRRRGGCPLQDSPGEDRGGR